MYFDDHIAFAHLQKCGGTTLKNILKDLFNGQFKKDTPHIEVPISIAKGRRVISSIRNPFTWYVSWWAHGCRDNGLIYPKFKDSEFWKGFYEDASNPELFRAWLKVILKSYQLEDRFMKYRFREHGLVTRRLATICCRNSRDLEYIMTDDRPLDQDQMIEWVEDNSYIDGWVRCENFNQDLVRLLREIHGSCEQEWEDFIENYPALNTASELTSVEAYDSESASLVFEAEKMVFQRFGYDQDPSR